MRIVGYIPLAFGGVVCVHNFYLSFLRYYIYKIRGRESEFRWVSGLPAIGSLLVLVALFILREPLGIVLLGAVLAAVDTGGLHWFVGTLAFMNVREYFSGRHS